MQYFSPHFETSHVGVLQVQDENLYQILLPDGCALDVVNGSNRALLGDVVYYETLADGNAKIVGIKERNTCLIPGVLILDRTTLHGRTKSGTNIYKCCPVDWRYPDFYVSSKSPRGPTNLYIVLKFESWATDQKFPTGKQVAVLGAVGNLEAEQLVLLYKNQLKFARGKLDTLQPLQPPLQPLSPPASRQVFTEEVWAIDPVGSRDFDDAFSYRLDDHTGNLLELAVHIADVTAYLTPEIWQEACQRITSLYLLDRVYNMLPVSLAEEMASLKGEDKLAVSVIYLYGNGNGNGNEESVEVRLSLLKQVTNLSYEQAENVAGVTRLMKLLKQPDTHKLVEHLMIKVNQTIGQMLVSKASYSAPVLIRAQEPPVSEAELPNSAYYCQANHPATQLRHHGLNLSNYTHFSSPIRRLADQLVHLQVKNLLIGLAMSPELPPVETATLNAYLSRVRKFYRELAYLKLFNEVKTKHGGSYQTNGQIQGYADGKLKLVLPEFEMECYYRLIAHKVAPLVQVVVQKEANNSAALKIQASGADSAISLPLNQTIGITIITNDTTYKLRKKITFTFHSNDGIAYGTIFNLN